jgi:hypothetical protein
MHRRSVTGAGKAVLLLGASDKRMIHCNVFPAPKLLEKVHTPPGRWFRALVT